MKRETGYYWVKRDGSWKIAMWRALSAHIGHWILFTHVEVFEDSDFTEIDERRIERKELINETTNPK